MGFRGNNVGNAEMPLSLTEMSPRMKRNLIMAIFLEMTIESKLLNHLFNDLGIILLRRQSFIR